MNRTKDTTKKEVIMCDWCLRYIVPTHAEWLEYRKAWICYFCKKIKNPPTPQDIQDSKNTSVAELVEKEIAMTGKDILEEVRKQTVQKRDLHEQEEVKTGVPRPYHTHQQVAEGEKGNIWY